MASSVEGQAESNRGTGYSKYKEPAHHRHLHRIREQTCYPAIRWYVGFFFWLFMLLGVFVAVAGIRGGSDLLPQLYAIIAAALIVFLAFVFKEASLMLVDIADATIEFTSSAKGEPAPAEPKVIKSPPAPPTSKPSPGPASDQQEKAPEKDRETVLMERYGITFDGERYHYKDIALSDLNDVVTYAARKATNS